MLGLQLELGYSVEFHGSSAFSSITTVIYQLDSHPFKFASQLSSH